MLTKFMIGGAAVALMTSPVMAANKGANLGDIQPGTAKTAQIQHFAKGTGAIVNGAPTEVYSSNAKAFIDTVLFNITPVTPAGVSVGTGGAFFTFQILSQSGKVLKNITNGVLSLVNIDTNDTVISNLSLSQAQTIAIPFTTGSYKATVSGKAAGANGGDYQITFSAPVAPVPEPAVVGSMGAGLLLAGFFATRRRRKAANVA